MWGAIISGITGAFTSWNDGRKKIKEAKIKADIAKWQAKEARYLYEAKVEGDWDKEALKQSQYSWKDEFITVLWFIPLIMLFVPYTQEYAIKGFKALEEVPYGYWLVVFGIVAASFGLRWLFSNKTEKAIKSIKGQ